MDEVCWMSSLMHVMSCRFGQTRKNCTNLDVVLTRRSRVSTRPEVSIQEQDEIFLGGESYCMQANIRIHILCIFRIRPLSREVTHIQ